MENAKINKIVLVSLCDAYTKCLAKMLAQSLGMIFCDTKDLIEYELIDKKAIEKECSKEYLEKSELVVMKHISSFVDVVVGVGYENLMRHYDLFSNESMIVFIKQSKKFVKENSEIINTIAYESRTEDLKSKANLTLEIKNADLKIVCEKVIKKLGGIL